ncbi:hypothetical protein BM43_7460 (plasmid) [Burkholderia gladioli]|nr:hypothetical protein BM43_7460 [Burkholderia gladioli]SPU96367.1 Uncharacterised protein [Burkholderia gladioli]
MTCGPRSIACSWDTRPLRAGELPVQRPAMPAEGARVRCAPRGVGASAGESVWLRSILLRRVKRVDLPSGAAPFRRIAHAGTGTRVKAALRFAHVLARSVLGFACAPHAACGRALAPVPARAEPASRRLPMADPQPDTKGRNRERNHPRPNHPHTRGRSPPHPPRLTAWQASVNRLIGCARRPRIGLAARPTRRFACCIAGRVRTTTPAPFAWRQSSTAPPSASPSFVNRPAHVEQIKSVTPESTPRKTSST